MIRVKICGITSEKDALAAVESGADALGFVFYPQSPRSIKPEHAKKIIAAVPPFVSTVGVFVDRPTAEIEDICSFTGINIVQLHGSEPPADCRISKKVIKAFRIKEMSDLSMLTDYSNASAFLLDTYSDIAIGGTGQVFNWEVAVEARKLGKIILAGGLSPDNIEDAIRTVHPYAVDVSSGVEGTEKGKKDPAKLKFFIQKAKSAFNKYA
jgi:phosphoribosylanthranilate isomerase